MKLNQTRDVFCLVYPSTFRHMPFECTPHHLFTLNLSIPIDSTDRLMNREIHYPRQCFDLLTFQCYKNVQLCKNSLLIQLKRNLCGVRGMHLGLLYSNATKINTISKALVLPSIPTPRPHIIENRCPYFTPNTYRQKSSKFRITIILCCGEKDK